MKYPIQFVVPEELIVSSIPKKTQSFSSIIPGNRYSFSNQEDYYKEYQKSYFAITHRKNGWDCLRHYEILMNGCIPYFIDLDKCPKNTMFLLPKDLIIEANNMEGIEIEYVYNEKRKKYVFTKLNINFEKFNKEKYFELLNKILEYTRTYLTTTYMARYILNIINYNYDNQKILYITNGKQDYMCDLLFHGLKSTLKENIIDHFKIRFLYKSFPIDDLLKLYGRGFTYGRLLEDKNEERNDINEKLKTHYYDYIIFGSINKKVILYDLIKQYYKPSELIFICGDDDRHKGRTCQETHNIDFDSEKSYHFIRELYY